jgi:hypothetical protein
MYSALLDAVEIEFLIEEKRSELFAKITDGGYSIADALPLLSSSEFSVQKIDPLDDGFVFQVVHNNNILNYYAFKHKEYVFCPAFLCEFLKLVDYSCLVVNNVIDYYYIILRPGSDDPLSFISDFFIKLLQIFKFIPPVNENKFLSLDLTNKDILMSLTRENFNKFSKDLIKEFMDECPISVPLFKSRKDSNYIFIRRDVTIELKANYVDLSNCFESNDNIFLHSSSAAAKKAKEFILLFNENERHMLTSLSNAFKATEYMRESHILDKLINLIRDNYQEGKRCKDSAYMSSMFGIFQSSGYGKSRLIERLGTRILTFHSSLHRHAGHQSDSVFLRMLFEKIQTIINSVGFSKLCYLNNIATATYVYLLRIMYLILIKKKRENQSFSRFLDIDEELKNTTLLPELPTQSMKEQEQFLFNELFKNLEEVCLYKESISYTREKLITLCDLRCWEAGTPLQLKSDLNKFSTDENANTPEIVFTNNLEGDVLKLLEEFQTDKTLPCAFVIDEAQGLLYKNSETTRKPFSWCLRDIDFRRVDPSEIHTYNQSPYTVFRRVFRIFSGIWERLMLINVSSCREIIVPTKNGKIDISSNSIPKYLKNFLLLETFNVISTVLVEIEADMFQKRIYQLNSEAPIKDWNEFLVSDFRIIEYFKFGRPLIYGIFKDLEELNVISKRYNLEATYQECCEFKYLAKKLSSGEGVLNYETTDIHCLYSMLNFAFGTNFIPSFISRDELVENYMMTVEKCIIEEDPWFLERTETEITQEEKDDTALFYLDGGFFPEGVINFLSARYFAKFPQSLSKLLNTCLRNGICTDKGYSELLAQFFALSAIFFHINCDLDQVRKLVFQPIYIGDFLKKLGEGSVGGGFLGSNLVLINARLSFGYFQHFPNDSIENPFDLMARCLFRGSALTLNRSFSDLNLMIPLVLGDGRISFIGIKAIHESECYLDTVVPRAVGKMNFFNIFGYHSDRPFVLIILILCDSNPQIHIEKPSLNEQNPLDNPNIIIFKGISQYIREHSGLFEIAPIGIMYGGIEEGYLEECDRMQGLCREFPPKPNKRLELL